MSRIHPRMLITLFALVVIIAVCLLTPLRDRLANVFLKEPDIVFSEARLVPLGGQLRLDARADIDLPAAVRLGLDSGVPLEFVVKLTIARSRPPWPDKPIVTQRWRYRLNYYELTRHYRINAIDGGESRNYRSLARALDGLGAVSTELSRPGVQGQVATLDMRLDGTRLPLPLRPVLGGLWRDSWIIRGAPYRWTFGVVNSGERV